MPAFHHVRSVSSALGGGTVSMVAIGLGTNLGDRAGMLKRALSRITEGDAPLLRQATVSDVYETAALLKEGAPPEWNLPFYNLVVAGECRLSPSALLHSLKRIEHDLGRIPRGHWAPREIDLDILAHGRQWIRSPILNVPHEHLLARAFTLLPLAELWPEWRYPGEGPLAGSPLHLLAEHYFPEAERAGHVQRLGAIPKL